MASYRQVNLNFQKGEEMLIKNPKKLRELVKDVLLKSQEIKEWSSTESLPRTQYSVGKNANSFAEFCSGPVCYEERDSGEDEVSQFWVLAVRPVQETPNMDENPFFGKEEIICWGKKEEVGHLAWLLFGTEKIFRSWVQGKYIGGISFSGHSSTEKEFHTSLEANWEIKPLCAIETKKILSIIGKLMVTEEMKNKGAPKKEQG